MSDIIEPGRSGSVPAVTGTSRSARLPHWLVRLAWFAGLWAAGVVTVGIVAYGLRLAVR